MNNYERHYEIQVLADTNSKYSLAKRIVELEEQLKSYLPVGEVSTNEGVESPCFYVALDEDMLEYMEDTSQVYIKVDDD